MNNDLRARIDSDFMKSEYDVLRKNTAVINAIIETACERLQTKFNIPLDRTNQELMTELYSMFCATYVFGLRVHKPFWTHIKDTLTAYRTALKESEKPQ